MAIRLSEGDRARVRAALGYPNVEPAGSISLGLPSNAQPNFLVDHACDKLVPESVSRVLSILQALDAIEAQMLEANSRLKVAKVDEIEMRGRGRDEPTEQERLEDEYTRWARRLADLLGVPLNPLSSRFGSADGSIPVALEF